MFSIYIAVFRVSNLIFHVNLLQTVRLYVTRILTSKQMTLTEIQTKKLELELVMICFEQFNDLTIIPNARRWGQHDEYNAP